MEKLGEGSVGSARAGDSEPLNPNNRDAEIIIANDGSYTVGDSEGVNPAEIERDVDSGGENKPRKNRRGRKKGGKNRPKEREQTGQKTAPLPISVPRLEAVLLSIHEMIAGFGKLPYMKISGDEAHALAEAMAAVAKHYPQLQVPEKLLDWGNLATWIATIYGPRVAILSLNLKSSGNAAPAEKQPRASMTPAFEMPMTP